MVLGIVLAAVGVLLLVAGARFIGVARGAKKGRRSLDSDVSHSGLFKIGIVLILLAVALLLGALWVIHPAFIFTPLGL